MLLSLCKAIIEHTCGTFLTRTLCSLALLTAVAQHAEARTAVAPKKAEAKAKGTPKKEDAAKINAALRKGKANLANPPSVVLSSPDIIEIAVQDLTEVQTQLSHGIGVSWSAPQITIENVIVDGVRQPVQLTRVFSVSSRPYIELIQANPPIGPWAPFNDQFGERPKSTMTWRIAPNNFVGAISQFNASGATLIADGSDFLYYQTVEGVQLQIIRDFLAPDPAAGRPNTPPAGVTDFGPMFHFSVALQPATFVPGIDSPEDNIPVDDFNLRQVISAATSGGITWDINTPITTQIPYRIAGSPTPALLGNPSEVYSCNPGPYLNVYEVYPNISPFGASASSTTFSQAWIPAGSGLDPVGAAKMSNAEAQLITAGYQMVASLNAQDLGLTPYSVNLLSYFYGVNNHEVLLVNAPFGNTICTGSCPNCTQ
ncbi:MAG: hypothetical protein JSR46_06065 [Verrucomicrobia bacterium]|nr:hypothetical protein [Verrucomicrobiota bacterium]